MHWEWTMNMMTQANAYSPWPCRWQGKWVIACTLTLLSATAFPLNSAQAQVTSIQETSKEHSQSLSDRPSLLQRLRDFLGRGGRLGPKLAEEIEFNDAFAPPGEKAPKSTENGGARDELHCKAGEPTASALMPPGNYGLTTQARPIVFIEASKVSAQRVVLAFQTATGEDYRQAILPIPPTSSSTETPEVWRFQLPSTLAPLAVGQNYRWSLAFICGDYLEPGDPMLSGWVQRVELNQFKRQSKPQTLHQNVQLLSQYGYWYDVLQILDEQGELGEG